MKKNLILILGLFLIGFVFAGTPQKMEGLDYGSDSTWLNVGSPYNIDNPYDYAAMTFTMGTTGPNENFNLTSVKLRLKKTRYTDKIMISIKNFDEISSLSGPNLSTGEIDGNIINGPEWYEIPMTPYELKSSSKYAIIINTGPASDYLPLNWIATDSNIYLGGNGFYFHRAGNEWRVTHEDCLFEVWGIVGPINETEELEIEERVSALENWKGIIEERIFNITEMFFNELNMIQEQLFSYDERISSLEENQNSETDSYFKYLSSAERKNIICEYAKANNLTTYSDLGWNCIISLRISPRWPSETMKLCSCKII